MGRKRRGIKEQERTMDPAKNLSQGSHKHLESHGRSFTGALTPVRAKHIMACRNKGEVSKSFSRFVI